MNALGICPDTYAIYEGSSSSYAARVTPAPLLLPIRFVGQGEVAPLDKLNGLSAELFREDSFDPVTKIRRGRVYSSRTQFGSKSLWRVQDGLRSDLPEVNWAHGRAQEVYLLNYPADLLLDLRKPDRRRHPPRILLGWEEHFTIWQIIAIEAPIGNGPVLTLKASFAMGDLPELIEAAIPSNMRERVLEQWDKLDATLNRLSAIEVVDRCRDFLSLIFGHLCGEAHRDLSKAIDRYVATKGSEDVHSWAGRIVARLHSRGKPNEQIAKGLRAPGDSEAQLAVRAVGLILIDLGWAR